MKGKKGLEISITMVVTLLIASVLLMLGFMMIFRLAGVGDEVSGSISADAERNIKQMLSIRGDRVALPYQTLELKSGKAGLVLAGVQNVIDSQTFAAQLSFDKNKFIAKGSTDYSPCGDRCVKIARGNNDDPLVTRYLEQVIEKDDQHVFSFPVSGQGARSGTYVLDLDIFYDIDNGCELCYYDVKHQVKVVVN